MNVLLIEPFFTGSHRSWMEGLRRHSRHAITFLVLPGRHWKWRLQAGALPLAREFLKSEENPDLILASDMLDVTSFRALTIERTAQIPFLLYFHENQAAYPWSVQDRDRRRGSHELYALTNLKSALASDGIGFNSCFNRDSFLDGMAEILASRPDYQEQDSLREIADKSTVLPVGMELSELEQKASDGSFKAGQGEQKVPLILWNHRWEFDKNPEEFFTVLGTLAQEGLSFEVALLGEQPDVIPEIFLKAREEFGERVVHFGYCEDLAEYAAWLGAADILPVTSRQEFFGVSVVQAIACGCRPLLPRRLSYPEIIPPEFHDEVFYTSRDDLLIRLRDALTKKLCSIGALKEQMLRYDWTEVIGRYDSWFESFA